MEPRSVGGVSNPVADVEAPECPEIQSNALAHELVLSVIKDSVVAECWVLTASSLRLEISKVQTQ